MVLLVAAAGAALWWRRAATTRELASLSENTSTPALMRITSPAFEQNDRLPAEYTCDGRNISPPLKFEKLPEGTKSLALVCEDPDAVGGTFIHWVVWNIPVSATDIAAGVVPAGAVEGRTDFGRVGYGGPCPPSGSHRYFFQAFALDAVLDLPAGTDVAGLARAMNGHILDKAGLVGMYR